MTWRLARAIWAANLVIWCAAASVAPAAGIGVGISIVALVVCQARIRAGLHA